MDYARKQVNSKKNLDCWTNIYRCYKCKDCRFQQECVGKSKTHRHKEVYINQLMIRIRLRFKTKIGLEKYNKRFHKGEVAQAHILHNLGYREFKMRSKKSCQNEVNLFSIAYNLKKIHNKLKKIGGGLGETIRKMFFWLDFDFYFSEL